MKPLLAMLALGLAASFAGAATPRFVDATAADAFKVYWLERAEQPPVIDGQLDEAL